METNKRNHQRVLLEMLRQVDAICKKHHIPYMLFAGTALGAVRHQDFIPWDDDIDILMARRDYERFLEVAPGELDSAVYFLQKEFSPHWPMFFSKLRKNNTTCIERYIPKDPQTHQGVYMDIFPYDNLSDSGFVRKCQFLASKVVIAKSLSRRGYLTDSVKKKLFIALCRLIPRGPMIKLTRLEGRQDTKWVHCFFAAASRYEKSTFPRPWVEETVQLPFAGGSYPVSAQYDGLLRVLYGDTYMTPAPPEERAQKIHGVIVDLEQSYETYLGIQKEMKFDQYTRSIR